MYEAEGEEELEKSSLSIFSTVAADPGAKGESWISLVMEMTSMRGRCVVVLATVAFTVVAESFPVLSEDVEGLVVVAAGVVSGDGGNDVGRWCAVGWILKGI